MYSLELYENFINLPRKFDRVRFENQMRTHSRDSFMSEYFKVSSQKTIIYITKRTKKHRGSLDLFCNPRSNSDPVCKKILIFYNKGSLLYRVANYIFCVSKSILVTIPFQRNCVLVSDNENFDLLCTFNTCFRAPHSLHIILRCMRASGMISGLNTTSKLHFHRA